MEENAKSWRNLFRCMQRVSGSSVTYHKSESNALWPPTHLAVLEPIPQLLAVVAAVHVVALQLVRREEVSEAVEERDVGSIEPASNPIPHPPTPTLPFSAHTAYCLWGGNRQRQVLKVSYNAFPFSLRDHHLKCLGCFGDGVTRQAFHTGDQSPVKNVRDNRPIAPRIVPLELRKS